MEKKTFAVEGMACHNCKANVENTLKTMTGIVSAEASVEHNYVTIEYNPSEVTPLQMQEAINNVGYEMTI